ncbi:hypothetical protein D3C79_400450 [compost metagenome]
MTVGDLSVDMQLAVSGILVVGALAIGVGLESQQVLQVDRQTIPGSNPQYQWTRTLVRTQGDLTGCGAAALGNQHSIGVYYIPAQGIHHAVGVMRTEPVEHQRLVHGHDIGHQGALALHRRLGQFATREPYAGKQGQPLRSPQPATYAIEIDVGVQVCAGHLDGPPSQHKQG